MKCNSCPALMQEGYEYPEEYCVLGEESREFNDGSVGCNRKGTSKINKDLELAKKINNEAFALECGRMVEFLEKEDN